MEWSRVTATIVFLNFNVQCSVLFKKKIVLFKKKYLIYCINFYIKILFIKLKIKIV